MSQFDLYDVTSILFLSLIISQQIQSDAQYLAPMLSCVCAVYAEYLRWETDGGGNIETLSVETDLVHLTAKFLQI